MRKSKGERGAPFWEGGKVKRLKREERKKKGRKKKKKKRKRGREGNKGKLTRGGIKEKKRGGKTVGERPKFRGRLRSTEEKKGGKGGGEKGKTRLKREEEIKQG